ncbi:hypothetical protein SCUCBS95973_007257 [Sporothrix curviconia]|uniref:Uncharacterized protein n=1 Tax=Sporothrix curviconia TaxID=1260050 RepID=A0ABP0CC91_9PEZI
MGLHLYADHSPPRRPWGFASCFAVALDSDVKGQQHDPGANLEPPEHGLPNRLREEQDFDDAWLSMDEYENSRYREVVRRVRMARAVGWFHRQAAKAKAKARARRPRFWTKTKIPPQASSASSSAADREDAKIIRPAWRAERRASTSVSEPLLPLHEVEGPDNHKEEHWRLGADPELHIIYRRKDGRVEERRRSV